LLGGSGAPGIDTLVQVLGRWGGLAESQVMLSGLRLPAPTATLINASMAHALDFDDTLDHGGSIHPGASVLGASLATADALGGVSGADLMLAVALGLDVSCRVALASTLDRGWHRTAAMGVFGAAAAAGKLLGLTVPQMVNAFGIAFSQAAGNRQCIVDGALTKRLQAGQAASSGVLAAMLAREGFTGDGRTGGAVHRGAVEFQAVSVRAATTRHSGCGNRRSGSAWADDDAGGRADCRRLRECRCGNGGGSVRRCGAQAAAAADRRGSVRAAVPGGGCADAWTGWHRRGRRD
jgi:2-methylcitrate dehydratase PrpD